MSSAVASVDSDTGSDTGSVVVEHDVIYVLGYWVNPYRVKDVEYFWFRCYDGPKEARYLAALKQKRGQPSRFTNWMKGKNRFFTSQEMFVREAQKVGLHPAVDD